MSKYNNTSSRIKNLLIQRDGLRCAITGQEVQSSDELEISQKTRSEDGGGNELENLQLVRRDLHYWLDSSKNTSLYLDELDKKQQELNLRERENFQKEQAYRAEIDHQKRELELFRSRLQSEQNERESRFENQLKLQRQKLSEDQALSHEKLQNAEADLAKRVEKLELLKSESIASHKDKLKALETDREELEKEKEKYKAETLKDIERKSKGYVSESLTSLGASAEKYHCISRNWSLAGSISLMLGVATGLYFGGKGLNTTDTQTALTWSYVTFYAFKGVIVIGLFVALAKYCFTHAQSFMHESIKNGERKHAINFGKFYLETYGADAEWSQIKEAFEHWNINSSTAFLSNDPDKFDPKLFENMVNIADSLQKLSKNSKPNGPEKPNEN